MVRDFAPGTELETPPGPGELATRLFPSQPTPDGALLDRLAEITRLLDDVLAARHAWFDCPVGYGVNTLLTRARDRFKHYSTPRVGSGEAPLTATHDEASLVEPLLMAFGQIAAHAMHRPNVTDDNVARRFADVGTYVYHDDKHLQTVGFHVHTDHRRALFHVAEELQRLLAEQQCRGMMIVSGMQQIPGLRNWREQLQLLASVVRMTPSVCWLFSGRNQHSMQVMFDDDSSPMAGWCARFRLHRIGVGVYKDYLAEAAQARWDCYIGKKATRMILALPRRNPYWLNNLCRLLWVRDLAPMINNAVHGWAEVVYIHRHSLQRELEHLSTNQRSVLNCLAQTPTTQPRAKKFVARTRVSSASVGQALTILQQRDLVDYVSELGWRVKNPAMQWLLARPQQLIDDIYAGRPVTL